MKDAYPFGSITGPVAHQEVLGTAIWRLISVMIPMISFLHDRSKSRIEEGRRHELVYGLNTHLGLRCLRVSGGFTNIRED